ncbi:hypothetical protein BBK36DRAFT_1191701 [Trichoderma citrinoviride]|uniref:Uncharacterized protein n=1 Tax=Trichoderma citrinoviride TaxID=58853 RepID=A0A2T4BHH8_9HYPO|nr:hypothetical protein BBK36DRAFT_1191701 [Trichoderma citrinoviride]PTB68728.1 hypothetical protein BBK36DRAFT_1191701 [Trichoderma citrinoviride]
MSNHKTRPARSNSLQRMLELERRYMEANAVPFFTRMQLERLQASASQANALSPNSGSIAAVVSKPPSSSPNRPAVQAHRIEPSPLENAAMGATVSRARETRPDAQIGSVTINVSSPMLKLDLAPESDNGAQRGAVVVHQSPAVDKPVVKAVSFDVPLSAYEEERRSICQSPSWEAYGRRKKSEKKDSKKEQKKEQLKKEQLKKEEERKEQERKEQLKKEQLKKEQQRKEELKKEQVKKEQAEKEQRKREQQAKASKREKEESALKNALIKKKRLSKQPPPSSSHAIEQANRISVEAAASSRDRQRPSSALEFSPPAKNDTPARPSHRRSGSFTSLIRSPFESRRASSDTARPVETGFIGGIKLEIQRYAANQKAAEEPQNMDESTIHPALRTNNAHNQKWSAPAARPIPDSQRRAYPPITRHPAAAAKTRSLISSAEMEAQDTGTMEKWRAFVGLKPKDPAESTKAAAQQEGAKKPAVTNEASKSSPALPSPQANANTGTTSEIRPPATAVPTVPTVPPTGSSAGSGTQVPQSKLNVSTGDHQLSNSAVAQKPPQEKLSQANLAQLQQHESSGPIKSSTPVDKDLVNGSSPMAGSLPPAPPRRSSKRNSLLSLDGSVSPVSRSRSPAHRPGSSDSTTSIGDRISGKPKRTANNTIGGTESQSGGVPLQNPTSREAGRTSRNQKPDPIEIPTWEDIQSSVMQVIETKVSLSPIRKSHSSLRDDSDFTVRRLTDDSVPTTSADDDSSDDFHSVSTPGTPDTSRPQSEKGLPPPSQDIEGQRAGTEQNRARNLSQSPVKQPLLLQIGGGFSGSSSPPKVTPTKTTPADRTRAAHHRTQSAVDPAPGADFLPKLKHQPLKAGENALVSKQHVPSADSLLPGDERANSKTQLVVAPWPASYLEEARKAAPLAPPPQVLGSPRLVPKGTPPASIRSQPSPTMDLTPTKGPRHTAGSPVGGEPIAKMFVECCGCKYYHDMPSNIYEAMANPEAVIRPPRGNVGFTGALSMTVKCPWCSHEMSTKCCAGYAAMVYVKERLH